MSEYEEGHDPFSINGTTENTTQEDAQKGSGGAGVSKEGFFHVTVDSVSFKIEADKKPHVLVMMKVLAGEAKNADQVGKIIYKRMFPQTLEEEEKEQKRIAGLASFFYQIGVMTEAEAFGNANFVINKKHFEHLEGCQAFAKVSKRAARKYEDKKTGEMKDGRESFEVWDTDVWNLHHEKMKDVPRDWEMSQLVGAPSSGNQMADDLDGV